ncbi:MAG TPA: YhjD/YihY/BrkB family envelope integrity protein [Solirubrobacteraceae bacterium]|nr:YhjD/YihY/BrkB family envelope integrity protein [Solirubrobacteraceae bacterium]
MGRQLGAARARYEGSWLQDIVTQLRALDFFDWTLIFAAELLWSALPFIILLSSLADERIDDDLSRHLGLNSQGAHIVRSLFRNSPSHAVVPIVTGLLIAFAGIVAVVASLQVVYERLFDQKHRGWRDLPRYVAWVAIVLALLIADGFINRPERRAAGPVVQALTTFAVATVFFAWTMHFLLDGRVPWRLFIRPALLTAVLWVALGLFSSLYFSSVIIDDSKTYGTIGVVFTFLSWFILIGSVIVLGAAFGAVWQQRTTRRTLRADGAARPDRASEGDNPIPVRGPSGRQSGS